MNYVSSIAFIMLILKITLYQSKEQLLQYLKNNECFSCCSTVLEHDQLIVLCKQYLGFIIK